MFGKKFYNTWFDLQLIHIGASYSIERMLALDEYTRSTSAARVLFVTIGLPAVMAALVLCQESIPLQEPADGWKANYGFWIRMGILGAAIAHLVASRIEPWLQVPGLSCKQVLVYCFIVGVGYVAGGMVVTELWGFPIPFFFSLTSSTILVGLLIGGLRAVVGGRGFRQLASQRDQRRRMNAIMALQVLMGMVYPLYQLLYNKVSQTRYELPALAILPVFKLGMKAVLASAASHKVDLIPEQVVFTIDFFDALYLATFMQRISTTSLTVVLTIDVVQTAVELQELHHRTRSILPNLYKAVTSDRNDGNLLTAIRALCSNSRALREQLSPTIRIRSCVNHTLSHEGRLLLAEIEGVPRPRSSDNSVPRTASSALEAVRSAWPEPGSQNVAVVFPQPATAQHQSFQDARSQTRQSKALPHKPHVLQEALEVLFASECIILTEYLEVFIPTLYGTFLLVMVHLPSRRYHTEMEGVTPANVGEMASRIFIYALLELVSFILLAAITKRNCGINVLYQLAFVLETHMSSVIAKLTVWLLVTLAYRVVHFGADFTFTFEWTGITQQ